MLRVSQRGWGFFQSAESAAGVTLTPPRGIRGAITHPPSPLFDKFYHPLTTLRPFLDPPFERTFFVPAT